MTINAIQNTLQTLQAVATQAAGSSASRGMAENASATGFAGELRASLNKVAKAQNASGSMAKAFQLGDPNIALNDVMLAQQKAGIGFDMAVQVRNKLVGSYKEIMNMPV